MPLVAGVRGDLPGGHIPGSEQGGGAVPPIVVGAAFARQAITVCRVIPTRRPISVFDQPSAAGNTIRARCTRPAAAVDDRVNRRNRASSPGTQNQRRSDGHASSCRIRNVKPGEPAYFLDRTVKNSLAWSGRAPPGTEESGNEK